MKKEQEKSAFIKRMRRLTDGNPYDRLYNNAKPEPEEIQRLMRGQKISIPTNFSLSKESERMYVSNRIMDTFSEEDLKYMYSLVYNNSIGDNNEKSDILQNLIGSDFTEIGVGTNRYCATKDGFVWKFALDNRGFIDNISEFNRSKELSQVYVTEAYECNGLITIAEYVELIEQSDFLANLQGIREMLKDLSKTYIIGDLGLNTKNFCNYGVRNRNETIVMLDYAYLYPLHGNEEVLVCPKCGEKIDYTTNYTDFICSNPICGGRYTFMDIRRRMDQTLEKEEMAYFSAKPGVALYTLKEIYAYIEKKEKEREEQKNVINY